MAIVVEDGTGLSNAESYISVLEYTTYLTEHDMTDTHTSDAEREAALRHATQWIDGRYLGQWGGHVLVTAQALSWPRGVAYDREGRLISGLPQALKDATAELAHAHGSTALNTVQGQTVRAESVGEISVEYAPGSGPENKYPQVDRILALISSSAGTAAIPVWSG